VNILRRDVETKSTLDLREVGAWQYAIHPSTDIWCYAYAVDDEPVKLWVPGEPVPPEVIEVAQNPDFLVSAFNDNFERLIEQHILAPRYGWPLVPIERHRCTQAASLAHALPPKLEDVAKALSLAQQKDAAGHKVMMRLAKPRKPRQGEDPHGLCWHEYDPRLGDYCKQDVDTERALHRRVGYLSADEQKLWELDAKINDRGLHLDGKLIDASIRITQAAQNEINTELLKITNGVVGTLNQTAKLIAWLGAHGCEVPDVQKTTLQKALTRQSIPPEAHRVIELRLDGAHAAAAKLHTMRDWCNGDGRVRGALKYHGASTGRWTSFGIQLQNLKRPTVENIENAIEAVATGDLNHLRKHYSQPMSVIGDITRALISAAPGHRLIAADFSGIESRVTAWLSGQQTKLDQWTKFDSTQNPDDDPYFTLGLNCGLPREKARSIGKTADLAFGYMGGVGAWKRLAPDDTSTEDQILKYRDSWRRVHPQTVRFWGALDRAAVKAVRSPGTVIPCKRISFTCEGDFLFMRLPSGRRLAYPFPRLITNSYGNCAVLFKDMEKGRWVDCHHGQGAYGGIWIENAVQATARDLFAAAMPRLEAAGYPIVLHVHDEIVAEVANGFGSEADFKAILLMPPPWATGLPLSAKTRNGPRFCKRNGTTQSPPIQPEDSISRDAEIPWEEEKRTSEAPEGAQYEYNPSNDDATRNYASGESDHGHRVATYIYRDAGGNPYLKVVRTSAKQFPQFHWNNGSWVKGKPTGSKIPYRLPELITAKPETPIFNCEGEKDADNTAALGLVATTNSGGAGKWTDDLNKWFVGKQVIYVLEDNDAAGRAHTAKVASALAGIVPEIRVVSFPELPEHGDVSDWLDQGHTREELLTRAKAAPKWEPPQLRSGRASRYEMRSVEWIWKHRIAQGALNVLAGLPDKGKGQTWCNVVARITTGGKWPAGEGQAPKGNAIIFSAEDDIARTVIPRLVAAGADLDRVEIVEMMGNPDGSERMFNLVTDLPALKAKIEQVGDVVLAVIDPVAAYLGVGKIAGGSSTDVRGVLSPLTKLAEEKQTAILAIMHFNKKADITNALLRIADSIAYTAIARSIYIAVDDPENENAYLFVKAKGNLAPRDLPALRYTISVRQVGFDRKLNRPIEAPFILWDDNGVQITALEAMEAAAGGSRGNARDEAEEFLRSKLANGPVPADEIYAEAKAQCIAIATLKRAKKDLHVVSEKERGKIEGEWCWRLPT
jgi:DNA polymerase